MEAVAVAGISEALAEESMVADIEFGDGGSRTTEAMKLEEDQEMVHVSASGEIEMELGVEQSKADPNQEDKVSKTETTNTESSVFTTPCVTPKVTDEEEKETKQDGDAADLGTTPAETATKEDDIIFLDDEEDHAGVTDSKRARTDNEDESMQIDENGVISKEEVDMVGKAITRMSRGDLEDLVLAKIVEAIVAHTEVGQLRAKVLELQQQKDRMATKMGVMLKQVGELSTAVNNLMENESRDPKTRNGKPHVIRFNRSVGLQTSIEPSVRSAPPKIIRVADTNQNGVKQYGASAGKQQTYGQNGLAGQTQTGGVKRVYQGGKTMETNKVIVGNAMGTAPSPRKVYSAPTPPPRIAPKPPATVTVTAVSQNSQPGIVDLTDDDPPQNQASSATEGTTAVINGVPYQIVNTASPNVRQIQIMPSGVQTQQKLIVTPTTGQPRPMLLQQVPSNGSQQVLMRGISGQSPVTVVQRPPGTTVTRTSVNTSATRVAATIAARPANNTVVLASNTQQKKFQLPSLPVTPTPKTKNDVFRPPPKPELTLNEQADGIVLSWNLPTVGNMAEVTTYQIFACQESLNAAAQRNAQWKRVGDVKALPLPMACTLSQFTEENRYYFIVRGIDIYNRVGPFCEPQSILLRKKKLN